MPSARATLSPPTGPYYVASSLAAAQAWASAVDAKQGYPRAGVFAAPGPFQPATPFVTQTYSEILVHPSLQQWAYPSDPVTDAALVGANALPAASPLSADWAGTQPVPIAAGVQALAQQASRRASLATGLALAAGVAGIVAAGVLSSPAPSTAPSSPDAAELDGGDGG